MQVTKIEMLSGAEYHCLPEMSESQGFMRRNKGNIAKVSRIEMTADDYCAIPATNEAYEVFAV